MVEERTEPAEETVPFQNGRANCAGDRKAPTSNEGQDIRVRAEEAKGMKSLERRVRYEGARGVQRAEMPDLKPICIQA